MNPKKLRRKIEILIERAFVADFMSPMTKEKLERELRSEDARRLPALHAFLVESIERGTRFYFEEEKSLSPITVMTPAEREMQRRVERHRRPAHARRIWPAMRVHQKPSVTVARRIKPSLADLLRRG